MTVLKNTLMAATVGVFAIAGAMPSAKADGVTIWQCANCLGSASSALNGSNAPNVGPTNEFTTQVATGIWNPTTAGVYTFFDTTDNSIGQTAILPRSGFLGTGSGTATGFTFASGITPASQITQGPTGTTGINSEWLFTFSITTPSIVSITHDDGIALFNPANTLLQPLTCQSGPCDAADQAKPTTSDITTFAALTTGTYSLWYVSSNGLPEVLEMSLSPVPLPATAWLFGAGLAGLGLLTRRRRNSGLASAV
jgi:hypothetical protein